MNCRNAEKLLSSYLDNSLTEAYRDKVREHLAKCKKCTDELNAITKLDNLLKLKVTEKPSEEYWENYWQKLESKLNRTVITRLSKNRSLSNLFSPLAFSSAFSGVIIALLILVNSILYINIQELKSSITTIEGQEKIRDKMYSDLTHLRENMTPRESSSIINLKIERVEKVLSREYFTIKKQEGFAPLGISIQREI